MGFIGRSVPQLNILSIGFSVRVLIGLVLTLTSLYGVGWVFLDYLASAFDYAHEALGNLLGE
jgi:flagellar biosynthesis protein FliR